MKMNMKNGMKKEKQNGFKSIGEFEESVILSRALKEDAQSQQQKNEGEEGNEQQYQPYANGDIYELESRPQNFGLPILAERSDLIEKGGKNDMGFCFTIHYVLLFSILSPSWLLSRITHHNSNLNHTWHSFYLY